MKWSFTCFSGDSCWYLQNQRDDLITEEFFIRLRHDGIFLAIACEYEQDEFKMEHTKEYATLKKAKTWMEKNIHLRRKKQ